MVLRQSRCSTWADFDGSISMAPRTRKPIMGKMSPEASLWLIAMALFFSGAVTSFHATPTEANSQSPTQVSFPSCRTHSVRQGWPNLSHVCLYSLPVEVRLADHRFARVRRGRGHALSGAERRSS